MSGLALLKEDERLDEIPEVDFERMPPSYEPTALDVIERIGGPVDDDTPLDALTVEWDYLESAPWPEVRDELRREWHNTRRRWAVGDFYRGLDRPLDDRIDEHNRRDARGGTLTIVQWRMLRDAFDGKCAYCGGLTKGVIEHVVPICRGGRTNTDNILPSCFGCNREKGTQELHQWKRDALWWGDFLERCAKAAPKYRSLIRAHKRKRQL